MLKELVLIAVLLGPSVIDAQTNWCSTSCGTNHIGCNHNGNFAPTCVSPSQVTMTSALKAHILNVHNNYRNKVALGQQAPFSSARRMAQMVWNDDLAFLAGLNTKQCKMAHDACSNTAQFAYSGQNLGIWSTTAAHFEPFSLSEFIIKLWYDENVFAKQSDIDQLTSIRDVNGNAFGHFTAVVVDRQTAVGCAIAQFKTTYNSSLVACNYASTNMLTWPVYRSGVAASGCTLGADSVYPGLCKTSEPINPNSSG